MTDKLNVDQMLDIINRCEISYASNIWVPSLKRDVKFAEINTSQQKRLIKSGIDSSVFNIDFLQTLRDIIKENCKESIDIDQLTIVDKLVIAIALRSASIGAVIEVDVKIDDKDTKVQLDLAKIYDIVKSTIAQISPVVITDDIFEVTCNVPTIKRELDIEIALKNLLEGNKNATVKDALGDAFVSEAVKYIAGVTIKTNGPEGNIDTKWDELAVTDKTRIINKLKTKTLNQVIQFANTVREEADKVELVSFEIEGKPYQKRLTIDENFFMIS